VHLADHLDRGAWALQPTLAPQRTAQHVTTHRE